MDEIEALREEVRELKEQKEKEVIIAQPTTPAPAPQMDPALEKELRAEISKLVGMVNELKQADDRKTALITELRGKIEQLGRQVASLQGALEAYKDMLSRLPATNPAPAPAPRIVYTTPPAPEPAPRVIYTTPPAPTPEPRIIYTTPPSPVVTEAPAPRRVIVDREPERRVISGFDSVLATDRVVTIYYNTNSTRIQDIEEEKIAKVAEILNKYDEAYVRILGYADATGRAAYNLDLSKKRANMVKERLTSRYGVMPFRLSVHYYGEAESGTNGNDPSSRKVEMEFYKK